MNLRNRVLKSGAALVLAGSMQGMATIDVAGAVAGDPSQWGAAHRNGAEVAGDPSQWGRAHGGGGVSAEKVNEYEGQHR